MVIGKPWEKNLGTPGAHLLSNSSSWETLTGYTGGLWKAATDGINVRIPHRSMFRSHSPLERYGIQMQCISVEIGTVAQLTSIKSVKITVLVAFLIRLASSIFQDYMSCIEAMM